MGSGPSRTHCNTVKMRSELLNLLFSSVLISIALAAPLDPPSLSVIKTKPSGTSSSPIPPPLDELAFKENGKGGSPKVYSMEIETDIRLRYATTKVSSRVANPNNEASEAVFHIVLPETAFISSFQMEIEGKVYKALVKEKETAQNEYNQAVSQGQTAAQVSSSARDSNQFTVSVNIEPNSKVAFNLTYEQLLTRRKGVYEHTVHINPGTIVPVLKIRTNINEILPISDIKVLPFENDIGDKFGKETTEIVNINATTSTILFEPTQKQQKGISKSGLNGQFTVQYDVDRSSLKEGGEIHVVDGYFVHFFAPPSLPVLPKHVVFVLDTSGSMAGTRLQQTKEAMESILGQLRSEDIFSVVEFSSSAKEWDLAKKYVAGSSDEFPYPPVEIEINDDVQLKIGDYDDIFAYPVSESSIKLAKDFVRQMIATGGTNINDALVLALRNTQSLLSRTKRTPIIIFLTDGEATVGETSTDEIARNVKKANSDRLVSIFSLAFGTGADFSLQKKVSTQNRGFARKIYEASDTTLQLEGFFNEIASPILSDVSFTYEGQVTDVTETKTPNFFNGTEWCTVGKVPPFPSSQNPFGFRIEGTGSDGNLAFTRKNISQTEEVEKEKSFSLEKMWAYSTIQQLLKQSETDADNKSLKEKALNLSLSYEFVTPLTSLLVIKPNQNPTASQLKPASAESEPNHYSPLAIQAPPLSIQSFASFNGNSFDSGFGTGAITTTMTATTTHYSVTEESQFEEEEIEESQTEEAVTEESQTEQPCYDGAHLDTDPGIPFCDSYQKREIVRNWIENFPHNETHMSIVHNNNTLSLVTLNELPDQDYQKCDSPHDQDVTLMCKSIWHCDLKISRETLTTQPFNLDRICIIEERYVGFCCEEPKSE